ncbi:MAG: twin-arginine translocase TatA/TatE family subunit [Thermomicrobiales bacterium]|jgi:sec-independent protein translocase protein TatA
MIEGLFQPTHLILIAIVALIVLGPAKLGDLGGAMGRSVREFKENVDPDLTPAAHPAPSAARAALAPEERLALQERTATTSAASVEGVHAADV